MDISENGQQIGEKLSLLLDAEQWQELAQYILNEKLNVECFAKFPCTFSDNPLHDGNGRTGRLLVNLELMKAGYPPVDIKFTDRMSYYNAFDEYHVKHNLDAMEKLFAGYVNARLERCLTRLEE